MIYTIEEREEQKEAYQIIVTFLDEVESFVIPTDLHNIIDTVTSTFDEADVYKISSGLTNVVNDFDTYYNDYYEKLLETNERFIAKHPEMQDWYQR